MCYSGCCPLERSNGSCRGTMEKGPLFCDEEQNEKFWEELEGEQDGSKNEPSVEREKNALLQPGLH